MRNNFKFIIVMALAIVYGCSSDDSGNDDDTGGGLNPQATYKITFEPNFSEMFHPTDYPSNPGFSKMFVMAHSSSTKLYTVGTAASEGLKVYATEGDVSLLQNEYGSDEGSQNATKIAIGNDIGATGSSDSVTFVINPDLLEISFVSRMSPSPDWFVGVRSFSLSNPDNSLVDYVEIPLFPLDGGADAGTSYESDDLPETGPVTQIDGAPIYDDSAGIIKNLGKLIIERIN